MGHKLYRNSEYLGWTDVPLKHPIPIMLWAFSRAGEGH